MKLYGFLDLNAVAYFLKYEIYKAGGEDGPPLKETLEEAKVFV